MEDKKYRLYKKWGFTFILIAYLLFLGAALIPLFDGDFFMAGIIVALAHLLPLFYVIYFFFLGGHKKCIITPDVFTIGKETFSFDRYDFFFPGFYYTRAGRHYRETWHIDMHDRIENTMKRLFFDCYPKRYLEIAFQLSKRTITSSPVPVEITPEPVKPIPVDSFLALAVPAFFYALFLMIAISPLSMLIELLLTKDILFTRHIWPHLIIYLLVFAGFLLMAYYKNKDAVYVTSMKADKNKLSINNHDYFWDEITFLQLDSGRISKNEYRRLFISTAQGKTHYQYLLEYIGNHDQRILERWFYFRIPNRFKPVFKGDDMSSRYD